MAQTCFARTLPRPRKGPPIRFCETNPILRLFREQIVQTSQLLRSKREMGMSVVRTLPMGPSRLGSRSLFLPQRVPIDIDVLLRGDGPIEILRHGLLAELEDVLGAVEPGRDSPADAIVQC